MTMHTLGAMLKRLPPTHGSSPLLLTLLPLLLTLATATAPVAAQTSPACSNAELAKAMRIIDRACNTETCDFSQLRQLDDRVDKPTFLAALDDSYIRTVHLFFPADEYEISSAFDWRTTKRDQLDSIKFLDDPSNTIIFVLGQASVTGPAALSGDDHNRKLSYSRMAGVLRYLTQELQVECRDFRAGWFGREIMQLRLSDAAFLSIASQDYRDDPLILNQSVHVIAYPCATDLATNY